MERFTYKGLEAQAVKCIANGIEETSKLDISHLRDVRGIVGIKVVHPSLRETAP